MAAYYNEKTERELRFVPTIVLTSLLARDGRVPAAARAIAMLISSLATDAGRWCSPKQIELANGIGLARETVSRSVRLLVRLGYLQTRSLTDKVRGKIGLEYRLVMDVTDEMVAAVDGDLQVTSRADVTVISIPQESMTYDGKVTSVCKTLTSTNHLSELPTESVDTNADDNIQTLVDCGDGLEEPKIKKPRAKKIARAATEESMPREISHEMREIAERQNYSKTAAEESFACWRDWHISKGTEIAGHNASYSMWLRNAKRFAERDAQKSESDAERDRRARRTLH